MLTNYKHDLLDQTTSLPFSPSSVCAPVKEGGVGRRCDHGKSTSKEQGQLEAGSKSTLAPRGAINTAETSLMVYWGEGGREGGREGGEERSRYQQL